MRIAVVTITRDRLEYTKRCFAALRQNARVPFSHYVIDNGSEDGTADWLEENRGGFTLVRILPENRGIGVAWARGVRAALAAGDEAMVKLDNDGALVTHGALSVLAGLFRAFDRIGEKWILSPRVEGIVHQPRRVRESLLEADGHDAHQFDQGYPFRIGETGMVGGLCLAAPADLYREYPWPTGLPKAQGWDSALCAWARAHGWRTGYVEDLVVEHMDGTDAQARRYPSYHARKMRELGRPSEHWDALAAQGGGE